MNFQTQEQQRFPRPVVLIARIGKGCRQYVFYTLDELGVWLKRKPYRDEKLTVIPIHANRELGRTITHASMALTYVSSLVNEAEEHEQAALSLASTVLKQAENLQPACAFWFISALNKLASARGDMRVIDVLRFANDAMPSASQQWADYIADKT